MAITFGKIMKSIREKNNWTLEEMAFKLETTKQALSKYERGERTPKVTVAAKFADKLGVPLETFIGFEHHEEEMNTRFDPVTPEAITIAKGIDKLKPKEREHVLNVLRVVFAQYPNLFNE